MIPQSHVEILSHLHLKSETSFSIIKNKNWTKNYSDYLEFHLHYIFHFDGIRNTIGGWLRRKRKKKVNILTTTKQEILLLALFKSFDSTNCTDIFTYTK